MHVCVWRGVGGWVADHCWLDIWEKILLQDYDDSVIYCSFDRKASFSIYIKQIVEDMKRRESKC